MLLFIVVFIQAVQKAIKALPGSDMLWLRLCGVRQYVVGKFTASVEVLCVLYHVVVRLLQGVKALMDDA